MPEDQKWLRCRIHHPRAGASILLSIVKDANLLGVRSRIQKKENSLWSPVELPCPMLSCALYVSCQAATSCLTSSQHGKRVELLTQCVCGGAGLGWSLKCSYSFIRTISHNDNGIDRCWGKAWTARCLIILTSNWSLSQQLNCPLLTVAPWSKRTKCGFGFSLCSVLPAVFLVTARQVPHGLSGLPFSFALGPLQLMFIGYFS